jgi:hypothetical protein
MTTLQIVLLFAAVWFASGAASFIYWWTRDFDFTAFEVLLCLWVAPGGPFVFLAGYAIHGKGGRTALMDLTLIRRRDSQ